MENDFTFGIWSLLPLAVALIIAFKTRSATFALMIGCITGVVMAGFDPATGFNHLAQEALGDGEFIWICIIIFFIGILFEFYKFAGVFREFTRRVSVKFKSKKGVSFSAWLMGMFIIDDYFSPLMSGMVMRPLTDKVRISREKLAYILDSTTAAACVIFPFSAWGAYISGLTAEQGGAAGDISVAFTVFLNSIPYNFYSILTILFALGIALKIIPDFGPMRKAEKRSLETGKVLRDGATPLITEESESIKKNEAIGRVNLFTDLVIPLGIIIGIGASTIIILGSVKIAEAFIAAVIYMSVLMFATRRLKNVGKLMSIVYGGIKNVMPAIIIIALAFCLNAVTVSLGTSAFIIDISEGWLTPSLLVAATFFFTSVIAFSTGSSWGAYAIMIPFTLPIAYSFTGGAIEPLIYKCVGAVAGGGIFGDHSSPVSDTSVLSSAGAGSDHMDHVITQLPYALLMGGATIVLYLVV